MSNFCSRVIFSEQAYLGIVVETYERIRTETGGVLLGKRANNTWYVIECVDPGPNSIFQSSYFEYDTPYVNHLANKISRFYKEDLELIGLWHRHPGSFDQFSSTDDGTNKKYSSLHPLGAISGLVNLDPNFRFTLYHVPKDKYHNSYSRPNYVQVHYEVGDNKIPENLKAKKTLQDCFSQIDKSAQQNHIQRDNQNTLNREVNIIQELWQQGERLLNTPVHSLINPNQNSENTSSITSASSSENRADNNIQEGVVSKTKVNFDKLLEIIDLEISYLENQHDYNYEISPQDNQIKITMKYAGQMREFPSRLDWLFYLNNEREAMAKLNSYETRSYVKNIIQRSINELISKALNN